MEDYITPSEVIDHYEDTLRDLSKEELLALPYKLKEEGNKFIKSQELAKAIQSYVKALTAFHYLLNHEILKTTEQVVEYMANVEVTHFFLYNFFSNS